MVEGAKLVWGKIGLTFDPPKQLASAVDLGFMNFPVYRLFVIAVTAAVLIALWLFLEKTNVGLVIRAGSRDALMVRALGVDLNRIWLLVFGIGIGIAALAGVLAAPMRGVYAEMGVEIIIDSLRGRGGRRDGQPARRDRGRAPHGRDRQPDDVLRAQARRDRHLHRDGHRPARPTERPLRRSGPAE